jgi:pyruvate dehydrogenase (quinone)
MATTTTAADILIEDIMDWGVDVIFGLPGDGINGIMESLRKRRDQIKFIQVRHEEAAAFMASAYAKYTGKLGCCLATSGPGAIHLLNGLYDAKMDGAPVLALTGMTYHDLIGTHYQQDVNTQALFSDVAAFNERVMGPDHVNNLSHLACRSALGTRTVSHITFPADIQEMTFDGMRSKANPPMHTAAAFQPVKRPARGDALQRAADILNRGKKIVMLVGQGALAAGDEVEQLAAKLESPVVTALLGLAVLPYDSPYRTGPIGLIGTLPSEKAMEECDTLLMVGTSYPYMNFLPKPTQARAVQIDIDPQRIGLRYPVEVGLVGDAKLTLQQLIPLIHQHKDRSFLETAQKRMQQWNQLMDDRGYRSETPIKPQMIARMISDMADPNAIISSDSGTCVTWIARQFHVKRGQLFSLAGNLATMACGLPYSIAAKVAYPDRQSIAFVGDGAFTMLMGEMATAVKYNLPITVVILKNNTLGQIKWEQMVFLGNPEYGVELQPIDFARYAESVGAVGLSVEHPDELKPSLERAMASGRPAVVEVLCDPYEPPMPAQVKPEQAERFAESLIRGEPNRERIAVTAFRDKVYELSH